jgi:hypothetical protein
MIPFYGGEIWGYLGLTGSSMILYAEQGRQTQEEMHD